MQAAPTVHHLAKKISKQQSAFQRRHTMTKWSFPELVRLVRQLMLRFYRKTQIVKTCFCHIIAPQLLLPVTDIIAQLALPFFIKR